MAMAMLVIIHFFSTPATQPERISPRDSRSATNPPAKEHRQEVSRHQSSTNNQSVSNKPNLLTAGSISELEKLIDTTSPNAADIYRARHLAFRVCGMHRSSPDGYLAFVTANGNPGARKIQAAAIYDRFAKEYCDLDLEHLYGEESILESGSEESLRKANDPHIDYIVDRLLEVEKGPPFEDRAAKRNRLAEIMSSTDSPWAFETAARLVLGSFSRPIEIEPSLNPPPAFANHTHLVSYVAGCRVFGGCGAGSARMAELCGQWCESAMDIDAYLRTYYGPAVIRDIELFAQTFVRWRREGPRFY